MWTFQDVQKWIGSIGYPQYKNTFEKNFIDGRKLILVDASALTKMNITDFDDIKVITENIQKLYGLNKHCESIRCLEAFTFYNLFKTRTRVSYESAYFCEFLKELKFTVNFNHLERLHLFLQHVLNFQHTRVGNIERKNLYGVKEQLLRFKDILGDRNKCICDMPPCGCKWSVNEILTNLKIKILNNVEIT